MKKKIVFGFAGFLLALFVGNFIGNDVKEANAGVKYYDTARDCCGDGKGPVCCSNCPDLPVCN
jgi:hypothetical protein